MPLKALAAIVLIAAALPVSAAKPELDQAATAPAAGPDAKYCLRIEAVTGSRLESVECWTRQQWAEQCVEADIWWNRQCVDVDKEWAENGVRVIG